MANGIILWFNKFKGFGYLFDESGSLSGNIFTHKDFIDPSILNELKSGDRVEFEVGNDKFGDIMAIGVKKLGNVLN